jgi:hypothetical protein
MPSLLDFVSNTAKAFRSVIEKYMEPTRHYQTIVHFWKHSLRVHGFNPISGDTRRAQYEEYNYLLAWAAAIAAAIDCLSSK